MELLSDKRVCGSNNQLELVSVHRFRNSSSVHASLVVVVGSYRPRFYRLELPRKYLYMPLGCDHRGRGSLHIYVPRTFTMLPRII